MEMQRLNAGTVFSEMHPVSLRKANPGRTRLLFFHMRIRNSCRTSTCLRKARHCCPEITPNLTVWCVSKLFSNITMILSASINEKLLSTGRTAWLNCWLLWLPEVKLCRISTDFPHRQDFLFLFERHLQRWLQIYHVLLFFLKYSWVIKLTASIHLAQSYPLLRSPWYRIHCELTCNEGTTVYFFSRYD